VYHFILFYIMDGEVVLVADVGEVEDHAQTVELLACLADNGITASNDDLREMIAQGHVVVAKAHRGLAIDDECRQCGDYFAALVFIFLPSLLQM